MSQQTGSVPNGSGVDGGQGGPAQLSGLHQQQTISPPAGVNQSTGEAAAQVQHHHHPHDPYASAYPPYSSIVPYAAPYPPGVNTLPPYYPHDAAHHGQPPADHEAHDEHPSMQDQRGHPPNPAPSPGHPLVPPLPPLRGQAPPPAQPTPGPSNEPQQHSPIAYQTPNAGSSHDTPQSRPSPPQSMAPDTPGGSKRAYDGDGVAGDGQQAKRVRRATTAGAADGELEGFRDESDVGPSGGPKHWTDEEKGRLFHWMLDDDERWEAFGTKMNTIFREGSAQLFHSRKSFTALKSCYHRNLEIFKQIYVFEGFLARAPISHTSLPEATDPVSSSSTSDPNAYTDHNDVAALPLPAVFTNATERQRFLERKLEAAKALNIPVSNLTVKVIDHWFDMGWFILFKKRFHEDPKTGLPAPRYSNDREEGDVDAEGEEVLDEEQLANGGAGASEARRKHLDPHGCLIPPPFPNPMAMSRSAASLRSQRASPPPSTPVAGPPSAQQPPAFAQGSSGYPHSTHSSPQLPYGYPPHAPIPIYSPPNLAAEYQMQQQHLVHFQMQTAQQLTHLTNLTQTLLGTCNTLVELAKAQAEDIRVQTELLRRREEREESAVRTIERPNLASIPSSQPEPNTSRTASSEQGRDNRASLATEVLANPRVGDEVKHAAAEYLKRIFQ